MVFFVYANVEKYGKQSAAQAFSSSREKSAQNLPDILTCLLTDAYFCLLFLKILFPKCFV